jgi:hypothetical protein
VPFGGGRKTAVFMFEGRYSFFREKLPTVPAYEPKPIDRIFPALSGANKNQLTALILASELACLVPHPTLSTQPIDNVSTSNKMMLGPDQSPPHRWRCHTNT